MAYTLCMYAALAFGLAHAFVRPNSHGVECRRSGACAVLRHPVNVRLSTSEKRLLRLEDAFVDLCAAVLHADDVGLSEKHATVMGPIFMDRGFNISRRPLWLRTAVRDVLVKHDFELRPLERKWSVHDHCKDETT